MAKWGEWLYYSGGPKVINHKRLHKREGGESNAGSGCEGGRGGWSDARSGTTECGKLLETRRGKDRVFPGLFGGRVSLPAPGSQISGL